MTSPCKILYCKQHQVGSGGSNRGCFCAKELGIMRISMQRVGVDLCKCHAQFHNAQIGLVIHLTPSLFVSLCPAVLNSTTSFHFHT